jgi:hypothetical protein
MVTTPNLSPIASATLETVTRVEFLEWNGADHRVIPTSSRIPTPDLSHAG